MKLAIITPSFQRDHDYCVELCRSVDKHAEAGIEHVIVVPKRDMALFSHLNGGRRRVVADKDVLPPWVVNVPFPSVINIPGLGKKRLRTLSVTPRLRLVRGWIIQQVIKFSADRLTDADILVFADSDLVFVRPFGVATFARGDKVMLHHEPDCINESIDTYKAWQDVACDLLGIPHYPYARDNWVVWPACWRADRLREC